jgi:hypothetical protein
MTSRIAARRMGTSRRFKMAVRKIRDEADALRCLRAAGSSGGTDVDWAHAHGVDARSLQAWRMNMGRRGSHKRGLRLVELVPTTLSSPGARYVLSRGDVRVEFDDACAVDTLLKIVQVLRTC